MLAHSVKQSTFPGVHWRFLLIGAGRYARSTIASAVKLLLGRKTHYTAHDVLFRQYLGRLMGFDTLRAITSAHSPREGAGSQALMAMFAIRFAREQGMAYVHTPFAHIHHGDRPAGEWAAAWESHFNLGKGETREAASPVNYALTCSEIDDLFADKDPRPFDEALRAEFRRKYYADKTPRSKAALSVCVHVRHRNRYDFPDPDVADLAQLAIVVKRLRETLAAGGLAYELRIFSQGVAADFAGLAADSSELCLDADPIWTMRELVEADLLITTAGTFSYVAGLLCDGAVLADPRQFPLQPDWQPYDERGTFDQAVLQQRLEKMLSRS